MELDIPQALQEELTCVICLNCFIDPVTIGCGHSFCRPCLFLAWEEGRVPACPVCREPSKKRDLKTNILLNKLVSIARLARLRQSLSSEEHTCVTHKETKKIFCEEDKSLLCLLCSNSQGHEAHRHCPVEAAAEQQQEKLLKKMRSVWEKIQENRTNLDNERRILHHWIWYVYIRRMVTRDVYGMLHSVFHEEEEKQHLEKLIKEGKAVFQQLKTSEAKMIQKKQHLRKIYKQMKKMCQKPDVELLQDAEYLLERCELLLLHMPQPVNPKLIAQPITGLIDRLNQFRVEISFLKTNSHNVPRLDDLRTSLSGHELEREFLSYDEYKYFASLGTKSFSSGKHYWELDMNELWDWTLGVCKGSGIRKNPTLIESEDIFFLLCVKKDNHYNLFTTSPLLPHYIERPLGRVGVFLDFESGRVSFLNVAKSSVIWMYPAGSVNFPVRPFYFTGYT